jgi:archaemetzincin
LITIRTKTVIYIQPIGHVDPEVLSFLKHSLASISQAEMLNPIEVPEGAYDKARNQYEGSAILDALPLKEDAILGITEADAYVEGLNFIFGLAWGSRAFISLWRLRPNLYDPIEDEDLLKQRSLKEAVHELGHVFGLKHCPNRRCVMHFSNSIRDTDFKDWKFCRSCERKVATQ